MTNLKSMTKAELISLLEQGSYSYATLRSEHATLVDEHVRLQGEHTTLQIIRNIALCDIAYLERKVDQLEDRLEDQIKQRENELEQLQRKVAQVEQRENELEQLQRKVAQVEQLENKNSKLRIKCAQLNKELEVQRDLVRLQPTC